MTQEFKDSLNSLLSTWKLRLEGDNQATSSSRGVTFFARSEEESRSFKGMTPQEYLVYQTIERAEDFGVWKRDLTGRCGEIKGTELAKCLKNLESRKLIKNVKSVHGRKKVLMLTKFTPNRRISGGPWYTDGSFDSEFVNGLRGFCVNYIHNNTVGGSGRGATSSEVKDFIDSSKLLTNGTQLDLPDVQSLCDTLVFDGSLERYPSEDGGVRYVSTQGLRIPELSPLAAVPCGTCPVFTECVPSGTVSATVCAANHYLKEWMDVEDGAGGVGGDAGGGIGL